MTSDGKYPSFDSDSDDTNDIDAQLAEVGMMKAWMWCDGILF